MRFDILTLFPEMFQGPLTESILKRAREAGRLEIQLHNIRDYATDRHRSADDYPFGGGAGMVMKAEPLARCLEAILGERPEARGQSTDSGTRLRVNGLNGQNGLLEQIARPEAEGERRKARGERGETLVGAPEGAAPPAEGQDDQASGHRAQVPLPQEAEEAGTDPDRAGSGRDVSAIVAGMSEAGELAGGKAAPGAPQPDDGRPPVVLLTPAGRVLTQAQAQAGAELPRLVLICGHYEGIDERFVERYVTDEISIGDYVLTGGELGAMVIVDAVGRLVPGVLDSSSLGEESHDDGLLEYPHYTRPADWRGMPIPPVLVSGHHAQVARWRHEQRLLRTLQRRPDLLRQAQLSPRDRALLREWGWNDEA